MTNKTITLYTKSTSCQPYHPTSRYTPKEVLL